MTGEMLGSRGLRSHVAPARPVPARPEPPPAPAVVPRAPPARPSIVWMGPMIGVAAGWLISSVLFGGFGPQLEARGLGLLRHVFLGVALVAFLMILRRRRAARAQSAGAGLGASGAVRAPSVQPAPPPEVTSDRPSEGSILDEGVRAIRRMDPKFDPARFLGYIEMVFRATHTARMSGDVSSLRDRVTPELYDELQAQRDRSASLRRTSHVGQIEIRAEVTEAWHEDGRDYVTAYIDGSMLAYTVDEVTGALVDGSKTIAEKVEAFWTFTRPGGLNPWMLSAIQTS
jgi:predicted lipid-binding transport protein (Tim44 family)